MRRLRGGVDDEVDIAAVFLKNTAHGLEVTDISGLVDKVFGQTLELGGGPGGGGLVTEEVGPHVVVDADHSVAILKEGLNGFGTNEATGASNNCSLHIWGEQGVTSFFKLP